MTQKITEQICGIFQQSVESVIKKKPSRKPGREQLKTQALVRCFVTSNSVASLGKKFGFDS